MKIPKLLLILDGWGYSDNPDTKFNAIAQANTPTYDQLLLDCPNTLISGCGLDVGLPQGQMGNSEVGHLTIGAGRVIYQDLTLINQAIESREFFSNEVLINAIETAKELDSTLHIMGLLSPGGVHSHQDQIFAMIELAAERNMNVVVHAFLDGRDVPPKSAKDSLQKLVDTLEKYDNGVVASIMGRFYAMDRDKRLDRTQQALDLLTLQQASYEYASPQEALEAAYQRGETDEFVAPTICFNESYKIAHEKLKIQTNDVVIFMNFRADRARQLSYALTQPKNLAAFVSLTEYANDLEVDVAFVKPELTNVLGEVIEQNNMTQLRIAETEKYAHVTFFINGGREKVFNGEDRVLIPSPQVTTYDLQPQMSAPEVTSALVDAIKQRKYDFIICNYANADMVGHTGNIQAAIKACETIDVALTEILQALNEIGGYALITADHGNIELMHDDEHNQPHTAHTYNKVPLIYVGPDKLIFNTAIKDPSLKDIAPTLLSISGIDIPKEMSGKNLLQRNND